MRILLKTIMMLLLFVGYFQIGNAQTIEKKILKKTETKVVKKSQKIEQKKYTISLANFGVSKLEVKEGKIFTEASPIKINSIDFNIDKIIIERKNIKEGIEYNFSNNKRLVVQILKNRIIVHDKNKTIVIDNKSGNNMSKEASVYFLLSVKIEQELNLGIKGKLKDAVIDLKPIDINPKIVIDCIYTGGTSSAASARASSCASKVTWGGACTLLGIDTSCLWEQLVCVSVGTFDCD